MSEILDHCNRTAEQWRSVQSLLPVEFGPLVNDAVAALRSLREKHPQSISLQIFLAEFLIFADDPDGSKLKEAEFLLMEALAIDPFNQRAFSALSSVLLMTDRDHEATACTFVCLELECTVANALDTVRILFDGQKEVPTELLELTKDLFAEQQRQGRRLLKSVDKLKSAAG